MTAITTGTWFDPPSAAQAASLAQLQAWADAGWIRCLDAAFAGFLAREAPDAQPLLLLAAALASHQLGRGHACLELAATLADAQATLALPPERRAPAEPVAEAATPAQLLAGVQLSDWRAALAHPQLVARGDAAGGADPGADGSPLVLDGDRLYLRRWWAHERTVRDCLRQRLVAGEPLAGPAAAALRQALDLLFPLQPDQPLDWQRTACALAARSAFAVVTGGPGTGKTTTVVKLLAVLQHLACQGLLPGRPQARALRIRLAAPTGKAAARLNESIAGAVRTLALDGLPQPEALRAAIPTEVTTVHRLLGTRPDSRRFRHDATAPLPLDLLVVDEASMVDLELMAAVLQALPATARLVLLGDKDQLASVEAGAVLGALCRRADSGHYTPATAAWLREAAGQDLPAGLLDPAGEPLDQAVAKLRHSWRFRADSGIGRLAQAVNDGDAALLAQLAGAPAPDLAFCMLDAGGQALRALVLDGGAPAFAGGGRGRLDGGTPIAPPVGHAHYLQQLRALRPAPDAPPAARDAWALAVLAAFGRFQLLAALRAGPHGVDGLNHAAQRLLHDAGLVDASRPWYEGRPVLVTRNDYGLGLMNGDVGLTLATEGGVLRVAFADGRGGVRWVLPSRLQDVETVYAMTVHKSQGSEFAHAALVLPAHDSRVLTRELVYTGITRARHWCTLARPAGAPDLLATAVQRRLQRAGGALH